MIWIVCSLCLISASHEAFDGWWCGNMPQFCLLGLHDMWVAHQPKHAQIYTTWFSKLILRQLLKLSGLDIRHPRMMQAAATVTPDITLSFLLLFEITSCSTVGVRLNHKVTLQLLKQPHILYSITVWNWVRTQKSSVTLRVKLILKILHFWILVNRCSTWKTISSWTPNTFAPNCFLWLMIMRVLSCTLIGQVKTSSHAHSSALFPSK